MTYDVVIVGGGPAGLSAALALGRARKHVLLCDSGPRRNAAAVQLHNFVTRDGTPPDEFRRIGRQQLAHYPNVETRDAYIEAIAGTRGEFRVQLPAEVVAAQNQLEDAQARLDELPVAFGMVSPHACKTIGL